MRSAVSWRADVSGRVLEVRTLPKQRFEGLFELFVARKSIDIHCVVDDCKQPLIYVTLLTILCLKLEVRTQNPNTLFIERSRQRNKVAVSCHEHGNVDCTAEADLKRVDGKGDVDALLTQRL